jgi:hypothetical protein
MRPQKSFLHRILGIFVSQNDRTRYRVRPSLMQSNQSRKTPIVSRLGKTNELLLLVRNTDDRVGLLGGQTVSGALVVSYLGLAISALWVDASQNAS